MVFVRYSTLSPAEVKVPDCTHRNNPKRGQARARLMSSEPTTTKQNDDDEQIHENQLLKPRTPARREILDISVSQVNSNGHLNGPKIAIRCAEALPPRTRCHDPQLQSQHHLESFDGVLKSNIGAWPHDARDTKFCGNGERAMSI